MAPDDESRSGVGEVVVFWAWAGAIATGLAIMIIIPLTGR